MVFMRIINFVKLVLYFTLIATTALEISVPHVKTGFFFILTTEFAKLCGGDCWSLNVAVLMFAQNAIQVYHTWILTKNASAWLDSNLTPLQIFVSRVVIFTMLAVTAVIIPNA
jgi:hypothetical protein